MRICIPTDGNEGLAAAVAGHFGKAPFLTLVDTESGELSVISNAAHEGGHCRPAAPLEGRGVEAVLCSGVGRGAVLALEAAGIRVLATGAPHVQGAVEALRAGAVRELGVGGACAGHRGHEESCGH